MKNKLVLMLPVMALICGINLHAQDDDTMPPDENYYSYDNGALDQLTMDQAAIDAGFFSDLAGKIKDVGKTIAGGIKDLASKVKDIASKFGAKAAKFVQDNGPKALALVQKYGPQVAAMLAKNPNASVKEVAEEVGDTTENRLDLDEAAIDQFSFGDFLNVVTNVAKTVAPIVQKVAPMVIGALSAGHDVPAAVSKAVNKVEEAAANAGLNPEETKQAVMAAKKIATEAAKTVEAAKPMMMEPAK